MFADEVFVFTPQGDVINLILSDGTPVVTYSYDAWGVCTVTSDTSGCNISNINPFRYRGYYFDPEIEMYYLQSRYYDPENGRFVNVDESSYVYADGINYRVNLFTYCENNPINMHDPSGTIALSTCVIIGVIIGAALIGATLLTAALNYKYNKKHDVSGYVYGQNSVTMKFALSTVSAAGCGVIAAHNALVMLGKGQKLSEIVYYFDKRNAILGNLWAAPYWDVAGCVKKFGKVSGKTTLFPKKYDSAIKESKNKIGIVAFPWHYFLAKWDSSTEKFVLYNRYSHNTETIEVNSVDTELKGLKHLCLTTF
jgi:RHS repeat-associated protein